MKSFSCKTGFTLIELLIVVMILSALAAIAIPQFLAYRHRAYNSSAMSDLRVFKGCLEAARAERGSYPEL